MRSGFSVALFAVIVFAGGYFYNLAQAVCPIPFTYRIGFIDERFDLTLEEARVAVSDAAEIWEQATGQNLFSYDEDAKFAINFVFDERQEFTNSEEQFKDALEAAENVNTAIGETYAKLISEYNELKLLYEDKVEDFEQRFAVYSETVDRYNQEGGAPKAVFEELEAERLSLIKERSNLNDLDKKLDTLVVEVNRIGAHGNALIKNYNEKVGVFNEEFGESREFTQGDYNYGRINIYTFKDFDELELVLAHELGHALSLDHVEGEESVLYYLIGEQPKQLTLSETDIAEFNRVCGDMNLWDKIVYRLSNN